METLDTKEAAYIWHIDKSIHELLRCIKRIDGLLWRIRLKGRNNTSKKILSTLAASCMIILMTLRA